MCVCAQRSLSAREERRTEAAAAAAALIAEGAIPLSSSVRLAIVDSTYFSPPTNIGIGLSADTAMLLLPPLLERGCCCSEVTSQSPREGPATARQLVIHMTAFIVPQPVLLFLHLRPPPFPFPQKRRPSLLLFLRRFVPPPSSVHFCTGEQRAKFCCVALSLSRIVQKLGK